MIENNSIIIFVMIQIQEYFIYNASHIDHFIRNIHLM